MQKEQQTAYKCQYIMQTTCSLSCCVCHLLRQPIKATGQPIHRSLHKRPGWISCLWIQQAEDKGGLDTNVHSLHEWGALVDYVTMKTCIVTRYLLSHKSVNTTADQNNVWLQFQPFRGQSIRHGLQIMLQVNWRLKQQIDRHNQNCNCIARFSSIIIPAKAYARYYVITGVRLSVCLLPR